MPRARIGLLLLVLGIAAGLAWGFLPRPVAVDIARVEQGPLAVTVEEEGRTRVRDRYIISAPMSGYARRITLKVGDAVQRGEVLATLEPARPDALDPRTRAQASAQVGAAEAALQKAREDVRAADASAELARQELARAEALGAANFLSRSAVEQARQRLTVALAAREAARQAVEVARFNLDTARAVLARTAALLSKGPAELLSVRAPVDGRVLKVLHESEGTVAAGQPLFEIGDPEVLEVEVEVLSTQAVKIAPGTRAILDRWGGEHPLEGRVRVVEPAAYTKVSALGVEEQRVRVIVDLVAPREAWQRLGDGYRVEARFVVWEGSAVLQVPTSALFRHAGGWAVFAVEAGRARLRPVQVGQRSGLRAQVLSGLAAGQQVIDHPDERIADGIKVRPRG